MALYPMEPGTEGAGLPASPDHVMHNTVLYIKNLGMVVRGAVIPGSDIEMFREEAADYLQCGCDNAIIWNLTAIDPTVTPWRVVVTQTIDVHAAMTWLSDPSAVFKLNLDGLHACEELTFVPEGESIQTVFNDFMGFVTGGVTWADTVTSLSDDDFNTFFDNENKP